MRFKDTVFYIDLKTRSKTARTANGLADGQTRLGRWWLIAGNRTNEITARTAAGLPGLRPAQSLLTQSNY